MNGRPQHLYCQLGIYMSSVLLLYCPRWGRKAESNSVPKSCLFQRQSSVYLLAQDRAGRGQLVVWLQMNLKGHSEWPLESLRVDRMPLWHD